MNIRLKMSASRIGAYYEGLCKRSLVYNAVGNNDDFARLGWNKPDNDDSSAALAGDHWEKILFNRLKATEIVYSVDPEGKEKYNYQETVELLKSLNETTKRAFIYQSCVNVTKSFLDNFVTGFGENKNNIIFSNMYPDIILAEYVDSMKKVRLTVIDDKNADHIKINAQMQIALYAMMLDAIIKDEGIDNCFVNLEEGIVWNRKQITDELLEHPFKLREAKKEIEYFFEKTLIEVNETTIAGANGDEILNRLTCKLSKACEYCGNYEKCIGLGKVCESAKLIPYISMEAQDRLEQAVEQGEIENDCFDRVSAYLEGENTDLLTDGCAFWKNVKNDMRAYKMAMEAMCDGRLEKFPRVGATMSFPGYQDFALILTAQRDIDSGRVYAYSWNCRPGYNIDIFDIGLGKSSYADISYKEDNPKGEGTYYNVLIAENNTPEEFDRIDREFVEGIYNIFSKINEYQQDTKTLQVYVYDNYEYNNIETALYYMLEKVNSDNDQEMLEKIMALLFWFQGVRLATDALSQPEGVVDTPISVIQNNIAKLYVLSSPISYNLRTVSTIFSPDYNFAEDNGYYFEKLSNVMDGMPIIDIWKNPCRNDEQIQEKANRLLKMKRHLLKRVNVEAAVISALQKDAREGVITLGYKAARYIMFENAYSQYPEIARLNFENMYEDLLSYHQKRNVRMKGVSNAIAEGDILSLEYIGNSKYKVLNYENYKGNEWFSRLICEDNEYNRNEILLYRDTKYLHTRYMFRIPILDDNDEKIFFPNDFDTKSEFVDDGENVTLSFNSNDEEFEPVVGKRYLMFEIFRNANADRTSSGLRELCNRQELLYPERLCNDTDVKWDENAKRICEKYWSPDGRYFSESQQKAFEHLFDRKLTVLVGPPASGKTDFIARSIITLSRYYKETQNKNMKIAVSAMSHSAINNVLIKLAKMLKVKNPSIPNINLYKLDKYDENDEVLNNEVELIDRGKNWKNYYNLPGISVFGVTGWYAQKLNLHIDNAENGVFDLIIIDEASQVRAMDAFLQLELGGANTRYLLVGDDDQLPPIIGGKYAQVSGEKYIHGSIFRMYLTALKKHFGEQAEDVVYLNDNFRMNNILCRYSAETIYDETYKANLEPIATQKISLQRYSGDELLDFMLDPAYPMVFCKVCGISSEKKKAEIELTTKLVRELWDNIRNSDHRLAKNVGNFWTEKVTADGQTLDGACGIISPHHEHINKVRTSIASELGCNPSDVYIGTVDKLQGKERQAVIVTYGVTNRETVTNEAEFIFSRNRFNVSLTRGKAKTIVLLAEDIADSNISTNVLKGQDEEIEKGIDYIHGFSEFMSNAKPDEEIVSKTFEYMDGNVILEVAKKRII